MKGQSLTKIALGFGAGLLLTAATIGNSADRIESQNVIYKGYTTEGGTIAPKVKLYNPKTNEIFYETITSESVPKDMQVGKLYAVNYKIPKWESVFPKSLKSIEDIK